MLRLHRNPCDTLEFLWEFLITRKVSFQDEYGYDEQSSAVLEKLITGGKLICFLSGVNTEVCCKVAFH